MPGSSNLSVSRSSKPAVDLPDPHKSTAPKRKKIQVGPQSEARRKALVKARRKFHESKNWNNDPLNLKGNKNIVLVQKGGQPKHLADKIDPEALVKGRRELNKLPVYLAARALDGQASGVRAHGFVAIGQPGVRGAKIYSHFQSNVHSKVALNRQVLDAAKENEMNEHKRDSFMSPSKIKLLEDVFNNEVRSGNGPDVVFDSVQDFHRAIFVQLSKDFLNGLNDPALKIDETASPADQNQQIRTALAKLNPTQAKSFRGKVARDANGTIKFFTQGKGAKLPGLLKDGSLRQVRPSGRDPRRQGDLNAGELDARLFENPDQGDRLVLNQQDVSATDVIEANRMQRLRDQYLDEKGQQLTDEPYAPELIEVKPRREMTAADATSLFDDVVGAQETNTYAGVDRRDGTTPQMSMEDIKRTRRYQVVHVLSRLRKWFATGWAKLQSKITGKPMTRTNFATPGNCNSAAGSLLRLAGDLKGQKVDVKAGTFQHGVKVDTYWNPVDPKLAKPK